MPLGGVVPADRVAAERADERAVPLPAEAGEVMLLHNHLWHRSGRGQGGRRRLGFSVSYMGADVRCLRKRRAPRRFFRVFPAG
jgi:phytanoyl-CoA hydroxylase